jgi:hypothetical protein
LEFYKHVVKSKNARKQFFWCLRNPCENIFLKLPIFFVHKKHSKTCKGMTSHTLKKKELPVKSRRLLLKDMIGKRR